METGARGGRLPSKPFQHKWRLVLQEEISSRSMKIDKGKRLDAI